MTEEQATGRDAFFAEMLKALRDDLHANRALTRELLELVRDIRDEMAMMRADRERARANGRG
jgi:hypothetical protein